MGYMGPDELAYLSKILSPYGLHISRKFSKLQLAICISSSVYLTLGKHLDFAEAMKKAVYVEKPIWEI